MLGGIIKALIVLPQLSYTSEQLEYTMRRSLRGSLALQAERDLMIEMSLDQAGSDHRNCTSVALRRSRSIGNTIWMALNIRTEWRPSHTVSLW